MPPGPFLFGAIGQVEHVEAKMPMRRNFMESEFCATPTERQELLLERGVVEGKNLRGEDCGILCAGCTDGHRSDGDAGRHLHNGVEGIHTCSGEPSAARRSPEGRCGKRPRPAGAPPSRPLQ